MLEKFSFDYTEIESDIYQSMEEKFTGTQYGFQRVVFTSDGSIIREVFSADKIIEIPRDQLVFNGSMLCHHMSCAYINELEKYHPSLNFTEIILTIPKTLDGSHLYLVNSDGVKMLDGFMRHAVVVAYKEHIQDGIIIDSTYRQLDARSPGRFMKCEYRELAKIYNGIREVQIVSE